MGAPGVSAASTRSFATLAHAQSRGDRRGAQRRRLLVYLAPLDFPAPRRPLPRGSASSPACYRVPFELAKAIKVTPPRRPAGGVLYSETDTTAAKPPFPRVPGSRDGSPRPLYSTLEPRSRPGRHRRPWPRARRWRPGPPGFGGGRPAAERAWRPDASPPGRAPLSRGGPRCATVAALGFRRPACSPLAVVASEPTLGATAYVGGGGAGVRSRSPRGGPRLGGLALSKAITKS